jgi:hypothetical protein
MLPEKAGRIEIFPKIEDGCMISIVIIGTPDGLTYLARLLEHTANDDQGESYIPIGERQHIHLHAGSQLGNHSCEVEICRADAKGTGELPAYMR